MRRLWIAILLVAVCGAVLSPAWAQNPFTHKSETLQKAPAPPIKSRFFVKIILWQHQLKTKMADLIRQTHKDGSLLALMLLMGLAYAYGAVHAAGPGHGKAIATTYVLSHNVPMLNGILFGLFIAMIHAISGVVGVVGLRYIIEASVSETLANATTITQLVSFGLIAVLGLALVVQYGHALFFAKAPAPNRSPQASRKSLLPWAVAVGVVPCPAVVMVMLFCISMEVMALGLVLAACIALGMGTTIAAVVTAVLMGKSGLLKLVPERRLLTFQGIIGLAAGVGITTFGTLFLLAALTTAFY